MAQFYNQQQIQQQQQTQPTTNTTNRQVPARLSSMNLEGIFTSNRMNMENLINQNIYSQANRQPPRR